MDVFEALETTRAIRRFSDTPVSDEEIMTCIRAATQAPSGGNIQPWQFLVVRDAETKRAIGDVYRRAYGRYEPALLRVRPPARSAEEEASFQRMVRASRHLAEHLADAPALALVLMGRPRVPFRVGRRRPVEQVTHWERFGSKSAPARRERS